MHESETLTAELENARRQHAEELLAIESTHTDEIMRLKVAHTAELDTAAETTKKYHESLDTIEKQRLETKDFDDWADHMKKQQKVLMECLEEDQERITELETQLKQSCEDTAKYEVQLKQLKVQLKQSAEDTVQLKEQLKQSRETVSKLEAEKRLNQGDRASAPTCRRETEL